MDELSAHKVIINDPFWTPRLLTNARVAIFHQWQQLEDSRCIDNFRIAAGEKDGFREGWFFADSDAYKWLDAAARIHASWPDNKLKALMDDLIALLARVQMEDGYIYTYNQIHFPGERWGNLMIEHELYCHGHLIEAAVSHYEAIRELTALTVARKSADLLVRDFLTATRDKTSGHEEIEIALLRLHHITSHAPYLDLAKQFLERRGKVRPFAPFILKQNANVDRRSKLVRELRQAYLAEHPEYTSFQLPTDNYAKKPRNAKLRWQISGLTGKYFQMHIPIRKQTVPVGHSVRFGYLETAIAMLARLIGDQSLLPAIEKAWERMVTRRMYVTGGIGSLPELEGFGRDYELDPEIAYAETCAALGSLFWNWEMALITKEARYSDLFEWQLYNAAAVGMGLGGDSYLYNNPLLCQGGVTRRAWFLVPCCPSNLSRTWASLGKYIISRQDRELWIHQYIGCQTEVDLGRPVKLDLQSGLPWIGKIRLALDPETATEFTVRLRVPSWADLFTVSINGRPIDILPNLQMQEKAPVSGYDPRQARFLPVQRVWLPGDVVDVDFEMPILLRRASPRLRGHKGKVALTRGPLVYCLESVDNSGIDIFKSKIDPNFIRAESAPALLGGNWILRGKTSSGKDFTAIPYPLWANRGESQMTVWINA